MRKWLIALTIICGAGFLTSAGLAGKIYFEEANVYTDYDKQNIDLANINSIYINSDIPTTVKPTTGEAYVEFNQKFEDILGQNPEFELKVENKDKKCYINLEQIKDIDIWLMIKKDEAVLTLYLPPQALDTLQVEHQSYRNWGEHPEIDLQGVDIKNLDINQTHTDVTLNGKYENVNISSNGSSTVKINSKQKANVVLNGEGNYTLDGLFEKVELNGQYGAIRMNTLEPTQVSINTYNSDIKLEGSYSDIKIAGNSNTVNLKTNTLSNVDVENTYGTVTVDGPLNTVKVNNEGSNIDIQTTVSPKSIQVDGEQNTTVLRLPSNIPGFQIMRIEDEIDSYYYEEEEYTEPSRIKSDFAINKVNNNTYTYGDSSLKLMIQVGNELRILDNGYMSAK